MEKLSEKKMERTNEKQLTIKEIKKTPFKLASDGEKTHLTCGKILYQNYEMTEKTEKKLQSLPWEEIGVFIQAICYEIINDNNKNSQKN